MWDSGSSMESMVIGGKMKTLIMYKGKRVLVTGHTGFKRFMVINMAQELKR